MMPDDRYVTILADDDLRVKGTRVGVEQIVDRYKDGAIAEQIAIDFPALTLEQVHGVIAYYLRNQPDLEDYLRRCEETSAKMQRDVDSQTPPEVVRRLREIKQQHEVG